MPSQKQTHYSDVVLHSSTDVAYTCKKGKQNGLLATLRAVSIRNSDAETKSTLKLSKRSHCFVGFRLKLSHRHWIF